jgi:F420-0:gamma-glutamyl ligase
MTSLEVIALEGLPFVRPGDDLVELIASALRSNDVAPRVGDVLVVAQKGDVRPNARGPSGHARLEL